MSFLCQVPDDRNVSSQSAAVNGRNMDVYSFAVPISLQQQQQQHMMSASAHQQPTFVASQPVLASAGLVLVPADSLSAQPASAPVLWQVNSSSSQPAVPIATDNPAFFRVAASTAAGGCSLPVIDNCLPGCPQPVAFTPNFAGRVQQPASNILPASAAEYIMQNMTSCQVLTQPVDTVSAADTMTSLRNASSIPDIVLTGIMYILLLLFFCLTAFFVYLWVKLRS